MGHFKPRSFCVTSDSSSGCLAAYLVQTNLIKLNIPDGVLFDRTVCLSATKSVRAEAEAGRSSKMSLQGGIMQDTSMTLNVYKSFLGIFVFPTLTNTLTIWYKTGVVVDTQTERRMNGS